MNTQSKNLEKQYKEALDFLYSRLPMFSRVGAAAYKPGLETSEQLDEFFDHPHKKFRSIHIGGTNGKGSTSHMLASVLQAQGYKTGLYTSPHLVDFRERMKINGRMIPEDKVVEFVDKWKRSSYNGQPSFFELTMMMAFNWFAEEKVDIAVIEVGMGGRLDSTNIITPLLSVITNISHDHNQFLGNSLAEIAYEKAGIIKESVPVVIGEKDLATSGVFERKASEVHAPILFASERIAEWEIQRLSDGAWMTKYDEFPIVVPLGGEYQKKNIATALCTIDLLKGSGIEITGESVKKGLEQVSTLTGFIGRWTILGDHPLTIADTGHNIAGIEYNMRQLCKLRKERTDSILRIVIGFVADKAIDKIMGLLPTDAVYYITNASIPRALPALELKKIFDKEGLSSTVYSNVSEAYHAAQNDARPEDIIFIGGSTFIVADLLSSISS